MNKEKYESHSDLFQIYEQLTCAAENHIYSNCDLFLLFGNNKITQNTLALQSLDQLIERDKQREKDGFPRRIKLGKIIRDTKDKKNKIVIVPTTTEPKFYHDESITEELESQTGGSGEGKEGDVIARSPLHPQKGDTTAAGQDETAEHELESRAFDLGRVLTEKFHLPNLKDKGKKPAFTKYTYELTDINRRFGQLLEKKATAKRILQTNLILGRYDPQKPADFSNFVVSSDDHVYRIVSQEKDFETQAVVFFIRDYSGSMQGKPTEAVTTMHLFIYSWLVFQYQHNVISRFILHDTEAREVPDFTTYYQLQVAGGTRIAPAFLLAENIIQQENLSRDYNVYIFYGTDGDDWDEDGKEFVECLTRLLALTNRIGISITKNTWSVNKETNLERHLINSNLLEKKPHLLRAQSLDADQATENDLIESIKKIIS